MEEAEKTGKTGRNTLIVAGSEILCKIFEFIFVLYSARLLGAEGFGLLSFALAFTGLFSFLTDMGLTPYAIREIAKDKKTAQRQLGEILGLKTTLNITVLAAIILLGLSLGYPPLAITMLALVGVSMVAESLRYGFDTVFQSHEELEYTAASRIINCIVLLASAIFLASQGFGVLGFAAAYILARGAAMTYSFIVVSCNYFTPIISFNLPEWGPILKIAWPFGLTLFLTNIFHWIDQVMIQYYWGNASVGVYGAAYKLILALHFLPMAFNQAYYPVLSRTFGTKSYWETGRQFMQRLGLVGVLATVFVFLFAGQLIQVFFGTEYAAAAGVMRILVWSFLLVTLSSPIHRMLDAANQQKQVFKAILAGVVLNIILNLALIPTHGIKAAAYTTVASEIIFLILPAWYLIKEGGKE